MPFPQLVIPASGGGIAEYDTWSELPAAPADGTQALLCGFLVEYTDGEGWGYVYAPATVLPQGAPVATTAEGPTGSYGGEPPDNNDQPWDTAAWTLVT